MIGTTEHENDSERDGSAHLLMAYAARLAGRSLGISTLNAEASEPVEPLETSSFPQKCDIFISYSSNDRDAVVLPFVKILQQRELRPWFDVHEIAWGDSIIEKIQQGLSSSQYVIAFLSESYLAKPWPLKELRVALSGHIANRVKILPVLLGVSADLVHSQFPFLSEIRHIAIPPYSPDAAVDTSFVQKLVDEVVQVKKRLQNVQVIQHLQAGQFNGPIDLLRYDPHYQSIWISTKHSATELLCMPRQEPKARRQVAETSQPIDLEKMFAYFFEALNLGKAPRVSCADMTGNLIVVGFENGAFISTGCGYLRTAQMERFHYTPPSDNTTPTVLKIAPNMDILFGYADGSVCVRSMDTKQTRTLAVHNSAVTAMGASRASILVACTASGDFSLWSLRDYSQTGPVIRTASPIRCLSVNTESKDRLIAIGHKDGGITFWTFDGTQVSRIKAGANPISAVAFFPAGYEYIASADGRNITMWDFKTGSQVGTFMGSGDQITTLELSLYEERGENSRQVVLLAGSSDGYVDYWEFAV